MKSISRLGLAALLAIVAALTSCGPARNIVYLQDLPDDAKLRVQTDGELRLRKGDKVAINVHSRDQELVSMFNLTSGELYTVDEAGNIELPILGQMHVQGLSRTDIEKQVRYRLLSGGLLRDPIVTCKFPEMAFYVIGESGVGRHEFPDDQLNLLEALAICGDIPMSGKRTNVLVLRTEGDKQVPYRVDFTETDAVYSSPVYYIRQNDMIYVEPTQVKQNTSTANGSNYMTLGFWTGLLSLAMTISVLLTR